MPTPRKRWATRDPFERHEKNAGLSPRASARRGYTLTEIIIVISIMGTILGAIWVAADRVLQNRKITAATADILAISEGIKGIFAPRGEIPSQWVITEITPLVIGFNLIPTDMAL